MKWVGNLGMKPLMATIEQNQLKWYDHAYRMNERGKLKVRQITQAREEIKGNQLDIATAWKVRK